MTNGNQSAETIGSGTAWLAVEKSAALTAAKRRVVFVFKINLEVSMNSLYRRKDGVARKIVKIRGTSLTLVGSRNNNNQEGGSAPAPQAQAARPAPAQIATPAPEFDTNAGGEGGDDLPF